MSRSYCDKEKYSMEQETQSETSSDKDCNGTDNMSVVDKIVHHIGIAPASVLVRR